MAHYAVYETATGEPLTFGPGRAPTRLRGGLSSVNFDGSRDTLDTWDAPSRSYIRRVEEVPKRVEASIADRLVMAGLVRAADQDAAESEILGRMRELSMQERY